MENNKTIGAEAPERKKRILSCIQSSGMPTLGNYLGALKNWKLLSDEFDCAFAVADLHAITVRQEPAKLRKQITEMYALLLAIGLNPEESIIFIQSHVPAHSQLAWVLNCYTQFGEMSRMTQLKDKAASHADNVNVGLFTYPVLMAADILLYQADLVPVGADQKQHLEIARDIAHYFNKKYGTAFVEPNGLISEECDVLVGLDGRKMSKSYNNTIRLFTDEKTLQKTINKIVTDSKMPGEPKPLDCTINKLYKLFATTEQAQQFEHKLAEGMGWGEAKKELFNIANEFIKPMREKYNYYQSNRHEVDKILEQGAQKAKDIASKKMKLVRELIGVKNK